MKNLSLLAGLLSLTTCFVHAQEFKQLLRKAEDNHPMLKAKRFEVQASIDQVSFAKSTALPSLDAAYQVNYATHNNITGMAMSAGFVPISGPPSADNDYAAVFGSVGGLLLNWEPYTFGQRKARIASAKAYSEYQDAEAAQVTFQHLIRTAHAYLDLIMADELIKGLLQEHGAGGGEPADCEVTRRKWAQARRGYRLVEC